MGVRDWFRRRRANSRPPPPNTDAMDAALARLDAATAARSKRNDERSAELEQLKHGMEEDEAEALSILRRYERQSSP